MRLLFADVPEACDNMMVIATGVASTAISRLVLNGMPRHERSQKPCSRSRSDG